MKLSELITQLTDNLTDEQKAMDACYLDSNGDVFTIDTLMTVATTEATNMTEGQLVFAAFGTEAE